MNELEQNLKMNLQELSKTLDGELYFDDTMRKLYATDASAYREIPEAVAIPKTTGDINKLIHFAHENHTSLVPRAAGTSLAGQVVGGGIIVDVSVHFNKILEVNEAEHWVRVQPGVIRDDLNLYLSKYKLYFGPETSTANRAMIGGMVGNNSCGSNSMVYGSTREHTIGVHAILSDGSEAIFGPLSSDEFAKKCSGETAQSTLEQQIYQITKAALSDPKNRGNIKNNFPRKTIRRRNTGYALDLLMDAAPLDGTDKPFNFCKLIAGSEGTLAFITEIKLNLIPQPPKEQLLVAAHFNNVNESLEANLIALKYKPQASELMDHYILECTKNNIGQRQNRFFIQGDPGAILVVDLSRDTLDEAQSLAESMIAEMRSAGFGYHFPIITGSDSSKVWNLRKAGLGLLSNMPGDAKPVPVIEDTAVDVQDLPEYIREFNKILKKYNLYCVHYAHAGSGELHLRPILDLKKTEDTKLFRTILQEIATLVKQYRGSLSGEHGDGRLRGEFIRFMVGEECYELLEQVKKTWDPENIFNPGKIVDTQPMDTSLRYKPGQATRMYDTIFNFDEYQGILRSAELCNGSGDCRKTHLSGGTMCPSYMATKNEKDTTRARANILREVLTNSDKENPFDSEEIKSVMDLCLSCKGCKSECPSNVDVAKLKAEFLQHYYDANGVPFRTQLIAYFTSLTAIASKTPGLYNFVFNNKIPGRLAKGMIGFAKKRSMPPLHGFTLRDWYREQRGKDFGIPNAKKENGKVYLFCDEFTNYNDVPVGIAAIKLLTRLGYTVEIPDHKESGRTFLSKGMIKRAKDIARKNVDIFSPLISNETPLVGIEPSAILTFRDEYIDLASGENREKARKLADNVFIIDEFLDQQFESGKLDKNIFVDHKRKIKLHGHCHQKSLASLVPTKRLLSLPKNYTVEVIPSGCCGMAGSFGFEKEHYNISMNIGELVLFPEIRKQPDQVFIAAPGTSCRHQIKDGTGRLAKHPVEILWEAIKQ